MHESERITVFGSIAVFGSDDYEHFSDVQDDWTFATDKVTLLAERGTDFEAKTVSGSLGSAKKILNGVLRNVRGQFHSNYLTHLGGEGNFLGDHYNLERVNRMGVWTAANTSSNCIYYSRFTLEGIPVLGLASFDDPVRVSALTPIRAHHDKVPTVSIVTEPITNIIKEFNL